MGYPFTVYSLFMDNRNSFLDIHNSISEYADFVISKETISGYPNQE